MNIQVSLDSIYKYLKSKKFGGKNADYIPALKNVSDNLYAISIFTVDGKSFNVGDCNHEFAIESVSKVFSLALALKKKGVETVSKKIGTKQTNQPFNSISDIDLTTDHMLNSFENGGAMATTSLSYDKNKKKFEEKIFDMMSKFAGRKLTYSKFVYNSEIINSDHNRAIAYLLNSYGKFYGDVEETLDVYTKQCSALVTSKDVAVMAATLANKGINPKTGEKVIDAKFLPYILAHMSANGLYEYSETWMTHIGMPAKSGVSGVLLIVVLGVMGIGIISPPLDEYGNSVKGIITAMTLAQHMHLGIFDQTVK